MKKTLPALALAAIVFAIYAPALKNGFVWDDTAIILRDPLIRSWRLIPEGFQHFLFTDATASNFYRPIQRLTNTLDYGAFAFRPAGYHLTSILLHVGAALALLLCANQLLDYFGVEPGKRRVIAFLATLAWAIHPLHSSAVVYVSGRADPLAAAFGFLGLYFALRSAGGQSYGFVPDGSSSNGRRWLFLFLAGACFLLAALSKETGLLFLLIWGAVLGCRKKWRELIPASVVVAFVTVIYLSLRLSAEQVVPPRLHEPTPLLTRPVFAARALADYTGLVLMPTNLRMDRDVELYSHAGDKGYGIISVYGAKTILGALLAAAALYWLIRSWKSAPAISTCLLLATIAYLPVSGVFSLNATIAEHWVYVPTAFLFLACALFVGRLRISKSLIGATLGVWFLFLGVRTWVRNFDWRDQRTFLEHNLAAGGDSSRMLINLAGLELSQEQFDAAKRHLNLALKKEPNQPLAILNLATIAVRQNDFRAAHELIDRAATVSFTAAKAHELLAVLDYKETGLINVIRFRLAARTGSPDWSIEKRYIQALDESGALTSAIDELKSCLAIQWYRAESWQLLSDLLTKAGRTSEAIEARGRARAYDVHLD